MVAPLAKADWQCGADRRIMLTTPARTIADLAISSIERSYVLDAMEDVIAKRLTTIEDVIAATARQSPRRVPAISQLPGYA